MVRIAPLLLALILTMALANEPAVAPPDVSLGTFAANADIGFSSVQAALAALSTKAGVEIREKQGWTIISEPNERILWTFAPADHPAFPAVVKRQVVIENGNMRLDMRIRCEATTAACDKLAREFQQLYNKTLDEINRRRPGQP